MFNYAQTPHPTQSNVCSICYRNHDNATPYTYPIYFLAERELTLTHSSNDRARAEAAFKKLQRAQEGEKAKTEYEAETQSVREKTARLRALRLAKEAVDLALSAKKKPITASDKPVRC